MLTPAEELLAALKEHATAVMFEFSPSNVVLFVYGRGHMQSTVGRHADGSWYEDVCNGRTATKTYTHDSASSAVYSAFLRARK